MSAMKTPPEANRDDFEHWLIDMDDALERFMAGPAAAVQEQLDFSSRSLDVLEKWLLEKYPSTQSMLAPDQAPIVDGAARYIGETFRKAIGGHWDIELDNPKDVYFGLPILTNFEPKSLPLCPVTLATTSADRRTGSFLRTLLERAMNRLGGKKPT